MITVSKKGRKKEKKQKKQKPAGYFKGSKDKRNKPVSNQPEEKVITDFKRDILDPALASSPHSSRRRSNFVVTHKPVEIVNPLRPWNRSSKYPNGYHDNVVLYMKFGGLKRVGKDKLLGLMPIGYNVLIDTGGKKFKNLFVVTGFERGEESSLDRKEYGKWHLQYHANVVTLKEAIENRDYQHITEMFIEEANCAFKRASDGIEQIVGDAEGKVPLSSLGGMSTIKDDLSTASFYQRSLKDAIGDAKLEELLLARSLVQDTVYMLTKYELLFEKYKVVIETSKRT